MKDTSAIVVSYLRFLISSFIRSLTRWPRSAAIARSRAASLIGGLKDITTVFSPYFNASGRLGRLTFGAHL